MAADGGVGRAAGRQHRGGRTPSALAALAILLLLPAIPVRAQTPERAQSPERAQPSERARPSARGDAPHVPREMDRTGDASAAQSLRWSPDWQGFDAYDWILTGTAAASLLTVTALSPSGSPRTGGILFDESTRNALRAPTEGTRLTARDVSDVLLTFNWAYPFLVDALLVAAWGHGNEDVARELILMNAEVLLVTAALQRIANAVTSRERPYGRTCGGELSEDTRACDSSDRFFSFFSGHTSQAFAAAALTCTHHAHLPLYGGGAADVAPCVAGLGLAATTGFLRLVGDEHYATDVLTGAFIGTATGLLLPALLHYGRTPPEPEEEEELGVTLQLVPIPVGVGAVGTF